VKLVRKARVIGELEVVGALWRRHGRGGRSDRGEAENGGGGRGEEQGAFHR